MKFQSQSASFCFVLASSLACLAGGCSSDSKSSAGSGGATGGSSGAASGGSAATASGGAQTGGAAGSGGGPPPQPTCDVHGASVTPAFSRNSSDWGLDDVVGNRLSVADLDGDGFPDLLVHGVGSNSRGTDLTPSNRIFMNRAAPGGGRVFEDATLESGYGATRDGQPGEQRSAQFAIAADVDNDGDVDLFSGTFTDKSKVQSPATGGDLDRSEILLNDGTGHFTLAPALVPHGQNAHPTSGATFADVNRDGNVDLFVVGWYQAYGTSYLGTQARLYEGNGDGTFSDAAGLRGLRTDEGNFDTGKNHRPAYGTTACDVDDDGDTDLLVSAYGRQLNQLYLNDGSGSFSDVAGSAGFAGDPNQSYADNQFFLCFCAGGGSDPVCPADPNSQLMISCPTPAGANWSSLGTASWRNNGNTFSTACADVTGDGVADLYNAEIRHFWAGSGSDPSGLLVADTSSGSVSYTRPDLAASGLAWAHPEGSGWNEGGITAGIADFDLDGRPDILVGATDYEAQRAQAFHQQPDDQFSESAREWGIDHPCASGMAVADFDRDGDLDVILGASRARDCAAEWETNAVHLYENTAAVGDRWVGVELRGATSNGSGVGARVTVIAGGVTRLVQEVGGGYGHFGMQNDPTLLFAVGDCDTVDVEVRWPDGGGETQVVTGITPGQRLVVTQGQTP